MPSFLAEPQLLLGQSCGGPHPLFSPLKISEQNRKPILSHLTVHMVFKCMSCDRGSGFVNDSFLLELPSILRRPITLSLQLANSILRELGDRVYVGGRQNRRRRACKEEPLNLGSLCKMDNASVHRHGVCEMTATL